MWRFTQDKIEELERQNRIVVTESGMPYIKQYLDESPGRPLQSIWTDVPMSKSGFERTGYATQKPEALLERITRVSSNEGDTRYSYKEPGKYQIVVKVIDILGNDTTKTLEVKV